MIFDVFHGHLVPKIDKVFEENKLLKVLVLNNCTNRLQFLDLHANKALKDHLRANFQKWYVQKVSKQPQKSRIQKMSQAKWCVSAYDSLSSNPQLGINSFKEVGIIAAIENPSAFAEVHCEDDEDTFECLDS